MTRLLAVATAVLFTSAVYGECGDHAFYSTRKDDGTGIGLVATDKDLTHDPVWAPGHAEPPIGPGRAYDLAVAWAGSNWKRFDSFGLESINLQTVGCDPSNRKWVYVVSLAPVIDGNRLFGGNYMVGVLMDGTVIAPTALKKEF
jgi:hypothetical protein